MPRLADRRRAIAALALFWAAALALAALVARSNLGRAPSPWLLALAVISAAGGIAAAFFLSRAGAGGRVDANRERPDYAGAARMARQQRLAWIALPVLFVGAAGTGAIGSPLVVLIAVGVLVSAPRQPKRAAVRAAVALAVLIALTLIGPGRVELGPLTMAAAVLAAIGVLPVWQRQRADERVQQANLRGERLEAFLAHSRAEAGARTPAARGAPGGPGTPGSAETVEESAVESTAREAKQRQEQLGIFLRDVRDMLGAEEVVFWCPVPGDDANYVPHAWATGTSDGGAPRHLTDTARALVSWSGREQRVHCVGEERVTLAITPVLHEDVPLGALSLSRASGLPSNRDELKRWLPRFALQVAALIELLGVRAQLEQENRRTSAILNASKSFQHLRSIEELARAICETSLTLTTGSRTALIRWHADTGHGVIQGVSSAHTLPVGLEVTAASTIGGHCENGLPQVWESAEPLGRVIPLYGPGEPRRVVGSLGILPLKKDKVVTGAIVVEGDKAGDVREKDIEFVKTVAQLATLALDTLWEIEAAGHRAKTDALTGVGNRLFFDEHVDRSIRESDRSGATVSLIIADVDHFKKVNDSYGHDAGDAVLKRVASTLKEVVRASDVLARFGGEEFAILLPATDLLGAGELAERLRAAIEGRIVRFGGEEIRVTASFGVASYPETAKSRDAFFPTADRALYRAKTDGRNRVRLASLSVEPKAV